MTANKAPEHLQPLSSLGPMPDKRAEENRDPDDPVYLEYLEARGLLERGDYARAAMGFHKEAFLFWRWLRREHLSRIGTPALKPANDSFQPG